MPNLEARDWLTAISVILSISAFVYSLLTNTKRYELRASMRKDILAWYSATIHMMQELAIRALNSALSDDLRKGLLAKLSAQIEIGRFYFPNVKNDNYGATKPTAYQGHRNLALDFLVYYYKLFEKDDYRSHPNHVHLIEQNFTSCIFEIVDPRSYLRESARITRKMFSNEMTYKDFLSQNVSGDTE